MALVNPKQRSIYIQTLHILKEGEDPLKFDWQAGGYLSFEVYEGFDAWYGRLPRKEHRKDWPHDGLQTDLSRFDELVKLLSPVPREYIYPEFPAGELTLYNPQEGGDGEAPYLKAPKLSHHRDGSDALAARLLGEARVHELLLRDPHPHLGGYLGCVVEAGRVVRLALRRYGASLDDRVRSETPETFPPRQRAACVAQVAAAAAHLHARGLAHNDISPANVLFDGAGRAVLVDLDACAPLGGALAKGGLVAGWRGPLAGEGRRFARSSAACDGLAIEEIRRYLAEGLEEEPGVGGGGSGE